MRTGRPIVTTDAILRAQVAWEVGAPPDDGEFSPDSLSGLILASGSSHAGLAASIGLSPGTLRRWRAGVLMRDGSPFRPTAFEWEGIKAMLAPKAGA